jgi:hypothetical protein
MQSKAKTIPEYLRSLPPERRAAITAIRKVILKNLPKGYQERFNWGMISYEVPLKVFPGTYNGQPLSYAALASQKNHMAVYAMNVYADKGTEKWFRDSFKAAGKKLDMGKCCIRFKKLEDLALPVIGKLIAKTPMTEYVRHYAGSRKR